MTKPPSQFSNAYGSKLLLLGGICNVRIRNCRRLKPLYDYDVNRISD